MFRDRKDAGRQLAEALDEYRGESDLVLAIPRGGVEVGHEVALRLDAALSIIVSRKLPFPDNPEAGFGALAEDGSTYMIPEADLVVPPEVAERVIEEQKEVVQSRIRTLRGGRPLPGIEGRTVVLVDDGIAMGSTMIAAVRCCRNLGAGSIVVGAPVGGPRAESKMSEHADAAVIVYAPSDFRAVAQGYYHWYDVTDDEVLRTMEEWEGKQGRR
jgi:predicted phosphoribosyltransferase